MKALHKHIILMISSFLLSVGLLGQSRVEVITKTVEKSLTYKNGYSIIIEGESAKINVIGWQSKEIKVVMKFISKALTKELAERELTYQKYVISNVDEEHVIKNFLLVPNELKELSSIQETEIEVYLPKGAKLEVTNKFGSTILGGLNGPVRIESEYGDLNLNALSGSLRVKSNFGDLSLNTFAGTVDLNLTHTETLIDGFNGSGKISSNLGDLRIKNFGSSSGIKINSTKSDVYVEVGTVDSHYWMIKTRYGEVSGPNQLTRAIQSTKNIKFEVGDSSKPAIDISTDFGKIEISEL